MIRIKLMLKNQYLLTAFKVVLLLAIIIINRFIALYLGYYAKLLISENTIKLFDPQPLVFICYYFLLVSMNSFFNVNQTKGYLFFLYTLIIALTTNFIDGAIFLVILYPILRVAKLI